MRRPKRKLSPADIQAWSNALRALYFDIRNWEAWSAAIKKERAAMSARADNSIHPGGAH